MRALVALGLVLLCCACGYQLPAHEDSLPGGVKVLYLPLFANETTKPRLENGLTDAVVESLRRISGVDITADKRAAEAIVEGRILSYSAPAAAYDQSDTISEYQSKLSVEVGLRRLTDGRLLWRGRLEWAEPFLANDDKSIQTDLEELAIAEINRRLADDLQARLLDDF